MLFCRQLLSVSFQRFLPSSSPMSSLSYEYQTINVTVPSPFVFNVEMNRPSKMNAFNKVMATEMVDVISKLEKDEDCRVVILSGAGKMFSAGVDLSDLAQLAGVIHGQQDIARKSMAVYETVKHAGESTTCLEKCRKPVICCIHSACVGAGVDIVTATDIRLCTTDAWFCVKEVDMGLAADMGTLQRLPRVIGSQSLVNELCLTARKMKSDEAEKSGLVSSIFNNKEEMMTEAFSMAANIAAKSPVAVQGTKMNLVYSREHSVAEGLDHVARWNMTMIQSEDVMKAGKAAMDRTNIERPQFEKL